MSVVDTKGPGHFYIISIILVLCLHVFQRESLLCSHWRQVYGDTVDGEASLHLLYCFGGSWRSAIDVRPL